MVSAYSKFHIYALYMALNSVEEDHWQVAPREPVVMLGHVTQAILLQQIPC
jgi:hypothetical protein